MDCSSARPSALRADQLRTAQVPHAFTARIAWTLFFLPFILAAIADRPSDAFFFVAEDSLKLFQSTTVQVLSPWSLRGNYKTPKP